MSQIKNLAGQTALYGLSSIVGRSLGFLLVPFYTAVLTKADFGIYAELYAYIAFLNILYLFGMETTFFRFANKDKTLEESIFNQAQSYVIVAAIIFSFAIIILSKPIASLLQYPQNYDYVIFLALILLTDNILAIPFARLRLNNKAGRFAFIKIFSIVFTISLNLFFLVFCRKIYLGEFLPALQPVINLIYVPGFEVGYILLSNLIANAFQFPLLLGAFSGFSFSLNTSVLKPMLKYSYPLMFMGLAGMVNEVIDRILLKFILPEEIYPELTNQEVIGIYSACYKLSMFMTLAIQAFRYAADPFFFGKAQDKNAPDLFAKVMKYFIIVCSLIFLVVSINLDLVGLLLRDPSYRQGLMIVPVLLMANLFLGIYYNQSIWFKLTDKTHLGTLLSFTGAAITIAANVILIPIWGYMGSAVATLICYFSMALI
ncbi:MAG: oligosaccharide flippase family protein, partial [Bacteroidota bacterium]|nr:oligosaccharide flippase family protein [Bacteroidota bacterium]